MSPGHTSHRDFGHGTLREVVTAVLASGNGVVLQTDATLTFANGLGTLRGPGQKSYRLLADGRLEVTVTVSASGEYSGYPYYENHVGNGTLAR